MADSDEKYSPGLIKIMDIVQTITTLSVGGIAMLGVGTAALINDGEFSTHMYLVIFGYVLVISQGVMSMNPTAGWTRAFRYEHKRSIHLVMQVLGAILAIAGSAYAMSLRNKYNLVRTTHGIMGLTALSFMILSLIGGCVHAFARNLVPKSITRICHTLLGCLTIVFIFITFSLGFRKIYNYEESQVFPLVISLAVISVIGIVAPPIIHTLRRIMN